MRINFGPRTNRIWFVTNFVSFSARHQRRGWRSFAKLATNFESFEIRVTRSICRALRGRLKQSRKNKCGQLAVPTDLGIANHWFFKIDLCFQTGPILRAQVFRTVFGRGRRSSGSGVLVNNCEHSTQFYLMWKQRVPSTIRGPNAVVQRKQPIQLPTVLYRYDREYFLRFLQNRGSITQ